MKQTSISTSGVPLKILVGVVVGVTVGDLGNFFFYTNPAIKSFERQLQVCIEKLSHSVGVSVGVVVGVEVGVEVGVSVGLGVALQPNLTRPEEK